MVSTVATFGFPRNFSHDIMFLFVVGDWASASPASVPSGFPYPSSQIDFGQGSLEPLASMVPTGAYTAASSHLGPGGATFSHHHQLSNSLLRRSGIGYANQGALLSAAEVTSPNQNNRPYLTTMGPTIHLYPADVGDESNSSGVYDSMARRSVPAYHFFDDQHSNYGRSVQGNNSSDLFGLGIANDREESLRSYLADDATTRTAAGLQQLLFCESRQICHKAYTFLLLHCISKDPDQAAAIAAGFASRSSSFDPFSSLQSQPDTGNIRMNSAASSHSYSFGRLTSQPAALHGTTADAVGDDPASFVNIMASLSHQQSSGQQQQDLQGKPSKSDQIS